MHKKQLKAVFFYFEERCFVVIDEPYRINSLVK